MESASIRAFALIAVAVMCPAAINAQESRGAPTRLGTGNETGPSVVRPESLIVGRLDGSDLSISAFKGRILVLTFWNVDRCPFVLAMSQKLVSFLSHYANRKVALVLAVPESTGVAPAPDSRNVMDPVHARSFQRLRAMQPRSTDQMGEIVVDRQNKVAEVLGASRIPHWYVFDTCGIVRYSGAFDSDPLDRRLSPVTTYVRDAVDALLGEKPIVVSRTDPYG